MRISQTKLGDTDLGVPKTRIIVLCGLHWVPLVRETTVGFWTSDFQVMAHGGSLGFSFMRSRVGANTGLEILYTPHYIGNCIGIMEKKMETTIMGLYRV